MFGFGFADAAYSGHVLLGWRAIVEAGIDVQLGRVEAPAQAIALGNAHLSATAQIRLQSGMFSIGMTDVHLAALAACDSSSLAVSSTAMQLHATPKMAAHGVVSSALDLRLGATFSAAGLGINTAGIESTAQGVIDGVSGSIAYALSMVAPLTAVGELLGEVFEPPSIVVADEPSLAPLLNSFTATPVESELRDLFAETFESLIRQSERQVNALGVPHLGNRELVEQSLAADGLRIYQGAGSANGAGEYLLRAWRARNPKRGLHLLKTYLQMLWPNVWECDQLWHEIGVPYPQGLSKANGGNHYLTSRVEVSLPSRVTNGADLASVQTGLRASVPARVVLALSIKADDAYVERGIGCVMDLGCVTQSYEGKIN